MRFKSDSRPSKLPRTLLFFTLFLCLTSKVMAETLNLTSAGRSDYRIVIPQNPTKVDTLAAEELATFIEQVSGVKFPVVTDENPPTPHEIVIGHTNRLELKAIPVALQPQTRDGFV